MTKTLREAMTDLANSPEFDDCAAWKLLDEPVKAEYFMSNTATWKRWPGVHKNVYCWVELENGKAVAWNENPSKGWSFPVIKLKA